MSARVEPDLYTKWADDVIEDALQDMRNASLPAVLDEKLACFLNFRIAEVLRQELNDV